jgi:hypothetical protein
MSYGSELWLLGWEWFVGGCLGRNMMYHSIRNKIPILKTISGRENVFGR